MGPLPNDRSSLKARRPRKY